MSRRILVTGANGFLGAALVSKLVAHGDFAVCGTVRRGESRLITSPPHNLRYVHCDLAEAGQIADLIADWRPDAIAHAAAAVFRDGGSAELAAAAQNNVAALSNLLAAAIDAEVGRFVYCSSISVYGELPDGTTAYHESQPAVPGDVYGWSKLAGERILELASDPKAGMERISLRLAGIHGAGRTSGVVCALMRSAIVGEPLRVDEPESRFRLLFVDDAVSALSLALTCSLDQPYGCFNVAGADTLSLRELAGIILSVTGSTSSIEVAPESPRRNEGMDISAFQSAFGYRPEGTKAHLLRMLDWLSE